MSELFFTEEDFGGLSREFWFPEVLKIANARVAPLLKRLERAEGALHTCHEKCDKAGCVNVRLREENERLKAKVIHLEMNEEFVKNSRGCLMAGPGRGDCERFIGSTLETDEYGVPNGWCQVCFRIQQRSELWARIAKLEEALRDVVRYTSGQCDNNGAMKNCGCWGCDIHRNVSDKVRAALEGK